MKKETNAKNPFTIGGTLTTSNRLVVKERVFTLLVMVVFFASCNGQVKTNLPKDPVAQPKAITHEQSKLIKTQNSTQSDNVHCGLQDKAGNLWFGTTGEGVYRYNGKTFTQFTKSDGLSSNAVWSILEDKEGNIWFGTADGICRYDGKNIVPIPINESFAYTIGTNTNNYETGWSTKNTVWSMLQDKSGKIWFGMGNGVYYYNGTSFIHFLANNDVVNKDGLHLKMVDCILEDKNGDIWFASGMPPGMEGVCRYDGKSIISFKPNGDGWIRNMIKDKEGNIWFAGRNHGNFKYNGKTFTDFTKKDGIGNSILCDQSGNIWFTGNEKRNTVESDGGIWRYNGEAFTNFTTKDGMGKYFVFHMLEDRIGNIWIGTRNTGLYRYDGKAFTCFSE